jgi:YidC/Oxa1 family membrane protein insertase
VRAATAPLTVKQMRSMERLRRVQPQMKAIQEKYADDRQKQSEELMRLYRVEKVNPLGGCFPMLLQLPVFIGLFYALRSSIELRHAPFFGWITDLSAPESLFEIPGLGIPVRVLPLVMGATMFLQQKITPMQTPDPAQAKMMMTVMPVMMTVLFYQFPSGLVLYWMLSNVLAILHQLWLGRNMGPPGSPAQSGSAEPKAA